MKQPCGPAHLNAAAAVIVLDAIVRPAFARAVIDHNAIAHDVTARAAPGHAAIYYE
jgi:hypothetical protein